MGGRRSARAAAAQRPEAPTIERSGRRLARRRGGQERAPLGAFGPAGLGRRPPLPPSPPKGCQRRMGPARDCPARPASSCELRCSSLRTPAAGTPRRAEPHSGDCGSPSMAQLTLPPRGDGEGGRPRQLRFKHAHHMAGREEQGTRDRRYHRLPVAWGDSTPARPAETHLSHPSEGPSARPPPHRIETPSRPPTNQQRLTAPFSGSHWLSHGAKPPRPPRPTSRPFTQGARGRPLWYYIPRAPPTGQFVEADGTLLGSNWPSGGRSCPRRCVTQRGSWRRPVGGVATRLGTGRCRASPVRMRHPPFPALPPPPAPPLPRPYAVLRCVPEPARSGAANRPGARPRLTGPTGAARSGPPGLVWPGLPATSPRLMAHASGPQVV